MKVLLIYTGGTIGMAATPTGFAPAPGLIETALDKMEAEWKPMDLSVKPYKDTGT